MYINNYRIRLLFYDLKLYFFIETILMFIDYSAIQYVHIL